MEVELLRLLLFLLALVVIPGTRRRCLERQRLDFKRYAQLLEDEGQFHKVYKMSRALFMALAAKLEPFLQVDEKRSRNRTGIDPINPINKLHMLLRWLGGGSYQDIRVISGVSVAAFYDSIHEVADAIIAHPDLQLQFRTTEAAQRHAARQLKNISSSNMMKGCIGAVDGWLCPIRVPEKKKLRECVPFFLATTRDME